MYQDQSHKLFYVTLHSELVVMLKLAQILFFVSLIDTGLRTIDRKLFEFQKPSNQITDKNIRKNKKRFSVYDQLLEV